MSDDERREPWEPEPPARLQPPPGDDWMVLVVFGIIAFGFLAGLVILSLSLLWG